MEDQPITFYSLRQLWSLEGMMTSYKAEVLSPTGWTSPQGISKQVQGKLDTYSAEGWRLREMVNISGTGAVLGGAIGPYLVLVFEHD
jgi:hypothetical protein